MDFLAATALFITLGGWFVASVFMGASNFLRRSPELLLVAMVVPLLVVWALTNPAVSGAINAAAPGTVTYREFSDALGRALRRPSWLPVPGFVLLLLYGELAGAVLLKGQRVVPRRAQELGFTFRYPTIDEALRETEGQ